MTPRHILSLSVVEKRAFLNSIDHVFSDIDGVVWTVDDDIRGAVEGMKALQTRGKSIVFITNNSMRPVSSYIEKLKKLSMDVDSSHILTPARSVVDYLKSINFIGLIYAIGSQEFKRTLTDAGYKILDGPTKEIVSFQDMIRSVCDEEPVRAVAIDTDFNVSSSKLIRAELYLRHPDCLLIAGATDMIVPISRTLRIMGPGTFLKMLTESSNKAAIVLGKPGDELAGVLKTRFNIKDTKRALMIGDMLEQDIGLGKKCGFQTLAVLSGVCTHKDLTSAANTDLCPDYYADSMADFLQVIDDVTGK